MKLPSILLSALALTLAACGSSAPVSTGDQSTSSSSASSVIASSEAMMQSSAPAMMQSSVSAKDEARVIDIVAYNFAFTPNAIRVMKGEKVIVRVTSTEGIHGFGIPDLGVNERVELGTTVDITLDTSTAGTFTFRCTVPCGPGHEEMTGTITIE